MIQVPVSTPEKPLTVVDFCAELSKCTSYIEVRDFAQRCPEHVRNDERFERAVAGRLAAIKGRKAAA